MREGKYGIGVETKVVRVPVAVADNIKDILETFEQVKILVDSRKYTPQNLLFNANLQEFSERVCHLSNLQTLGKISSQKCYEEIELLWQQLAQSFKALISDEFDVTE